MRRGLKWGVAVVVLLAVALGGLAGSAQGRRGGDRPSPGKLKVGDPAPDVELVALDGQSRFRLSERIGSKPLVLVFGSYT